MSERDLHVAFSAKTEMATRIATTCSIAASTAETTAVLPVKRLTNTFLTDIVLWVILVRLIDEHS
jgi:hypothetical protein